MPKKTPSYEELKQELDGILESLQHENLDVDTALKNYKRGLELVQQLETYLEAAENTIKEIKASFENSAS
jgi:exodeoxyribonuclease VII small subunit